mgnify:CR=1 FL=1
MGKYEDLAKLIVKEIGGKDNVISLTNCITRLRFKLKDEAIANTDLLKTTDGIVTVIQSGGQYQVVIGNHVPDVRQDVDQVMGVLEPVTEGGLSGNLFDNFVDMISGIFQPILAPLSAAGMLKGLNAILSFALGAGFSGSSTYAVLNAMGDGLFLFLPIFIGYTAMKKFGGSPFLGMMLASSLVYTGFIDGSATKLFDPSGGLYFFSIPFSIPAAGYGSTVMPIIAATAFGAYLEKQLRKIIPDVAKLFLVPFLTALITVPLTFLAIGPIMNFVADGLGQGLLSIQAFNPIIFGAIIGFTWQVLVMFGMHWALIPFVIISLSQGTPTALITGAGSVAVAQTGATLAVLMKTKNKRLKELAVPAVISGAFGITEPAIYGITLPKKRPFWVSCLVGGVTGAISMQLGMKTYQMGGLGIFRYTSLIKPDGNMSFVVYGVILDIAAFIAAFVLVYLIGFKDDEATITLSKAEAKKVATGQKSTSTAKAGAEKVATDQKLSVNKLKIFSPLAGKVLPLSEAKDPAFSEGVMGKGIVIEPTSGEVFAPEDGVVSSLFPTHHAIGILTDSGVEVLIHIGMDTVELAGNHYESFVIQGQTVKKGDKLLRFDIQAIEAAGYCVQTPVIITNTSNYGSIVATEKQSVSPQDVLLVLFSI